MSAPMQNVPVIRLWNCLLVPIQGELTDVLADAMMDEVLHAIHVRGASGLILDLSGVWLLDSHLCSVLSNLAGAAAFMGTGTAVCGMRAEMALTLDSMGIGMKGATSTLTLEEALAHFGVVPTIQETGVSSEILNLLMGEKT